MSFLVIDMVSRKTVSHSQMTSANPNKAIVSTKILETAELFPVLSSRVGLSPSICWQCPS